MGSVLSVVLFQPPPASYSGNERHIQYSQFHLCCESNPNTGENANPVSPIVYRMPMCYINSPNQRGAPNVCVLHSHGNATDIGQMYPFLMLLSQSLNSPNSTNMKSYSLCTYEYPGYGPSQQLVHACETPQSLSEPQQRKKLLKPSEKRIYESIQHTVQYLKSNYGHNTRDIVLFGTSLGSGPTLEMASRYPFRAVILQAPFTSVVRTKISKISLRFIDMFLNIEKIPKVKCPVLFIHGKRDELVPCDHSRQLFEALPAQYRIMDPVIVPDAGHNNIMEKFPGGVAAYLKTISTFLNRVEEQVDEGEVE